MERRLAATIPEVNIPWVESPFFSRELASRMLPQERRKQATEFHEQGFLVLPGVVASELVDRVVAETTPLLDEPEAVERRRVQDAWNRDAAAVRELATLPAIQDVLRFLYERRPIPFQTLNFKYGTEQRAHADAVHFSCLPPRYMCGVWVALEDVDAGNGPLFYHPGSQRLAELTTYDLKQTADTVDYHRYEDFQEALMSELKLDPIEFAARKGDALIWSSNIVHGGRPIAETGRTRRSQVTHYYFDGCIYYTPVYSEVAMGELYLKDIVDISTLDPVSHSYNGRQVNVERLPHGLARVSLRNSSRMDSADSIPVPQTSATARQRITELEQATVELSNEVARLRTSASFRLGHALLQPARLVRGREWRHR
jgi:hypothetical protein